MKPAQAFGVAVRVIGFVARLVGFFYTLSALVVFLWPHLDADLLRMATKPAR